MFGNKFDFLRSYSSIQISKEYAKEGSGQEARRRLFKGQQFDLFEQQHIQDFKALLHLKDVDYNKEQQYINTSAQPDDVLLRFLYANRFNKHDTYNQFIQHLLWLPETESLFDLEPNYLDKIVKIVGRDYMQRPILEIHLENRNNEAESEIIAKITQTLMVIEEYMFVPGMVESQIVKIYANVDLLKFNTDMVIEGINIFQNNFPCSLEEIQIIDISQSVKSYYDHIVRDNTLSQDITSKIKFITNAQQTKPVSVVQKPTPIQNLQQSIQLQNLTQKQSNTQNQLDLNLMQKPTSFKPECEKCPPTDQDLELNDHCKNCEVCRNRELQLRSKSQQQLQQQNPQPPGNPYGQTDPNSQMQSNGINMINTAEMVPMLVYAYVPIQLANDPKLMQISTTITPEQILQRQVPAQPQFQLIKGPSNNPSVIEHQSQPQTPMHSNRNYEQQQQTPYIKVPTPLNTQFLTQNSEKNVSEYREPQVIGTIPPLTQPLPPKPLQELMREQVPEQMMHTAVLGRNRYDDMIQQNNWDRYGGMPYYHPESKPKVEQQIDLKIPEVQALPLYNPEQSIFQRKGLKVSQNNQPNIYPKGDIPPFEVSSPYMQSDLYKSPLSYTPPALNSTAIQTPYTGLMNPKYDSYPTYPIHDSYPIAEPLSQTRLPFDNHISDYRYYTDPPKIDFQMPTYDTSMPKFNEHQIRQYDLPDYSTLNHDPHYTKFEPDVYSNERITTTPMEIHNDHRYTNNYNPERPTANHQEYNLEEIQERASSKKQPVLRQQDTFNAEPHSKTYTPSVNKQPPQVIRSTEPVIKHQDETIIVGDNSQKDPTNLQSQTQCIIF